MADNDSSSSGAIVAIVAIVVILLVAYLALRVPKEAPPENTPVINLDLNGSAPSESY